MIHNITHVPNVRYNFLIKSCFNLKINNTKRSSFIIIFLNSILFVFVEKYCGKGRFLYGKRRLRRTIVNTKGHVCGTDTRSSNYAMRKMSKSAQYPPPP